MKNIDITLQEARKVAVRWPAQYVMLTEREALFAAEWMEANNAEEIMLVRMCGLSLFKWCGVSK